MTSELLSSGYLFVKRPSPLQMQELCKSLVFLGLRRTDTKLYKIRAFLQRFSSASTSALGCAAREDG